MDTFWKCFRYSSDSLLCAIRARVLYPSLERTRDWWFWFISLIHRVSNLYGKNANGIDSLDFLDNVDVFFLICWSILLRLSQRNVYKKYLYVVFDLSPKGV